MATATHVDQEKSEIQKETYAFTLILSGFNELTEEVETALFAAGCDDALLSITKGVPSLDFHRESTSLVAAIQSAIEDVRKNAIGIKVLRVLPPGEAIIEAFNLILKLSFDGNDEVTAAIRKAFDEFVRAHREQTS
jgi:hypothetical protein